MCASAGTGAGAGVPSLSPSLSFIGMLGEYRMIGS